MKSIDATQWISWLLALIAGALSMVVFVFTTFETKAESLQDKNQIEKRLDRIEAKLDFLIQQAHK